MNEPGEVSSFLEPTFEGERQQQAHRQINEESQIAKVTEACPSGGGQGFGYMAGTAYELRPEEQEGASLGEIRRVVLAGPREGKARGGNAMEQKGGQCRGQAFPATLRT